MAWPASVDAGTGLLEMGATVISAEGRVPTTGSTGIRVPPTPTSAPRTGPYYALPVYVGSVGTKGGPRVDTHGRILHVHDRPIPGLYGRGT